MCALAAVKRHDSDARRYPFLVYVFVPLVALVLQAWLPRLLGPHVWFDLPLLVTVYISLARRDAIQAMCSGAVLGIFEDALSNHAIGINGVAKTVAGFLAASVGSHIDVDNQTVRTLMNFLLSLLGSCIYLFVYRFLLGLELEWNWLNELFKAIGNSVLTLVLYPFLDRWQVTE